MTLEVMLDLETMGNGNNAAIVSIGAVQFDSDTLELAPREFYACVDLGTSMASGGEVTASTIMWWLEQSDAARKALKGTNPLGITEALRVFSDWCGNKPIWGNASTFDNVILRNAYDRIGMKCPWHFTKDRCYRTMKNMFPAVPTPPANEEKHNALADARWQAEHLINILRHIRGAT